MKRQIRRISPHQSSRVIALVYAILASPLTALGIAGLLFGQSPQYESRSWFLIIAPALYGVGGYIVLMLFCLVYNFVAGRIGGIELFLNEIDLPGD